MISRRRFIQYTCGCALGALSLGSYSHLIEPRWIEIKRIIVKINELPKQFNGITIAQLSDLHHSPYVPIGFIKKCIREVNMLNPDVIVLTGDYVTDSNEHLPPVTRELAKLQAKEGVFAVVGNHDDKDATIEAFSKRGIHLLVNQHITLYRKNEYIFFAGVDDLWRGKVNLNLTFKGTDEKPKILLSHNPDALVMIKHKNVDFVIAGHTHGGQIRLPLYGPPVINSKIGARYTSGLFFEENTTMYVNRGIGISCYPVRFCARPEITLFTLKKYRKIA